MPKLTKRTYFSTANQYLTNSRLGDYEECPEYFYKRHVTGEITKEETRPLIIGSAIDTYLTEGKAKFEKKYVPVARRSKDVPKGIIQLTMGEYGEVISLVEKVQKQKAYKELRGHKRQVLLKHDMPIGLFKGTAGLLDFLKVDLKNKKAIITDLKSSRTIDPKKYFFHSLQYNYFRQLAFYGLLVKQNFGIDDIEYRHLTVCKDEIMNCQAFIFKKELIENEVPKIQSLLQEISNTKTFKPRDTSFEEAVVIGERNHPSDDSDSDGGWEI